jgi:hypothetical protein
MEMCVNAVWLLWRLQEEMAVDATESKASISSDSVVETSCP